MTGREVHRLAEAGSESGVRLVLNRLVEHGLVTANQAGKATLYVGNRSHVAWPAVETLLRLRQSLFDRMGDLVGSWALSPMTVTVFGSAARGDGDTASDIDVLVVHQHPEELEWQTQVDELREYVGLWTGNACHIYELTLHEFNEHLRTDEPIVAEWQREGVVVFGTTLDQLHPAGDS